MTFSCKSASNYKWNFFFNNVVDKANDSINFKVNHWFL